MSSRVALLAALFVSACAGRGLPDDKKAPEDRGPIPAIELMDVTPVWPIPSSDDPEGNGYLVAGLDGGHGAAFPRDVFDATPALTRVDEPDVIYTNLAVTGARLDPCFQEGLDAPCEKSVRLVFQPLLPNGDGVIEARDASLHAFYIVDDEREILDAIAELAYLRGDIAAGPLDVHPLLQGKAGREAFRDVLLPLIGGERLVRVTSMQVHAGDEAWTFSAFVIDELGSFTNPDQVFAQHVLSTGGTGPIHVSIDPPLGGPSDPDDFALLLDEDDAQAATLADRQRAFDAAARIENPHLNNSGTRDCVSCHVTSIVRATSLAREPLVASPDEYTSDRYDLTTPTDFTNTALIHNLGYRFDTLALSPRVIHETAVAAALADDALHP